METTALSVSPTLAPLAAGKKGLKRSLRTREHTVIVMLDETIITAIPPRYSCYGRRGEPVQVPIIGTRAKRVIHGALNMRTGAVVWLITEQWDQRTHQAFLHLIRHYCKGWHRVRFEDRGSPHTAEDSLALAATLHIEVRLLPVATPELNAMDHLWRQVKRDVLTPYFCPKIGPWLVEAIGRFLG